MPPAGDCRPGLNLHTTQQLTQVQLAWIRFRRHKPAMIGIAVIVFMVLAAVFAPLLTPESPYNMFSFDATNQSLSPRFTPGWWFMFGTDTYGHTIMSQIIWGARISLTVGFISALGTAILGILAGSVAGYFGGWIDTLMMRTTDVFLTLPFLPLLILAAAIWGQGHVWVIIGIFVVFTWPGTARLARASFLSLRAQEFTEAARAVARRRAHYFLQPAAERAAPAHRGDDAQHRRVYRSRGVH